MVRKWKMKTVGVLGLCVLGLFGCARQEDPALQQQKSRGSQMGLKEVDESVVKAGNEFGFDLMRRLAEKKNANLLISPLSLSSALTMTYNGASSQTQKEMAQTLRLQNLTLEAVNAANAALRFNLATAIPNSDPRIQLAIANSLWAQKGVVFDKDFLARNKQFYDAKVSSLDLSTPAAADAMNAWVKKSTKGKIEKMFERPLDTQTRLVLMNAAYFNGKWQIPFEKSQTQDAPFYGQNGTKKQVPMMAREGRYSYVKTKESAIVELPYGNGDLSLVLVLPDKSVSLDSLIPKISTENWDQWRSQMSPQEGTVSIPRFKMEYQTELQDTLQKMGMPSAFSLEADFTKMHSQKGLFLSAVRLKAVIEVNEAGTEAAAATSVAVAAGSAGPDHKPFQFIADRPFFGVIRDNHSGAILFLMMVREP